ncbi:MAG: ATP-dependent Clp protease proteolytic subunit, partial [Gemmatimonadales bacterium]|nr:ATP-dependent Clp protease proteolytic subunit [Gemmatimonadales bacterium]
LAPYVARSLREAAAAGAAAVYLDIDTPGGRVDAAERISDAIRRSEVPVYAFVNPRAFSAGALIAISAREVYMRPGAVMGAATPVDGEGKRAPEKMVSAMRAEFRAVAEERGLDPRIAEAMVDEAIEIPELVDKGVLLTLTSGEARKVGYAKGEVADEAALLRAIGHPGAEVVPVDPNWAEQVVRFLTNPLVSPLLLSLGMLGLVFEIKSGAFGLGGLLSLTSLGLFFGSSLVLGLAGWEEVLLLGLGLIALGVEVFVLPGFGVAGFLGIGAIAAAMVLALIGAAPTTGDVTQALAILAASLLITAAVVYAWLRHIPSSNRFGGLFLKGGMPQAEGYISAAMRADLMGKDGVALTDLRPAGTATIAGERVDVVTEGEYLSQGSPVRVIRSEGYRLVVQHVP